MTSREPAPLWRTPATLSTTAGGLAMIVVGAMQAVRPFDDDPRVAGEEHVLLGLFAASLLLLVPGLFALARHGTGAAVAGAASVSAGHLLLAFGATASNLHGEDYPWFGYVAAPANLAMLAGAVVMAVSLWRAGRVPRPIAAVLPAMWLCEIVLAQLGGGLIAGVYWLLVCRLPVPGAMEPVPGTVKPVPDAEEPVPGAEEEVAGTGRDRG